MTRSTNGRRVTAASNRYPRTARLNESLREVVAVQLERYADDDSALELVTITGVEIDGDLRHAKVFFSALDTKASMAEVTIALERLRVDMQKAIGRHIHMKRTPLLDFLPDPAITDGQRVESILRELNTDD